MPTLNVNVSKEALEKLKPLKKLGMGNFVSCAILDLSVERYLELLSNQVKTKKCRQEKIYLSIAPNVVR